MNAPAIGNEYESRWGLKVTIINIRKTPAKRNILISYTNKITYKNELSLVSERQLSRWYPFFIGVNQTIKINAEHLKDYN